MTNMDKYNEAFKETFEIEENQLNDLSWLKGMDFRKSVLPPRENNGASEIAQHILRTLAVY